MGTRLKYTGLWAVVSATAALCLFSSEAFACHCVAPNKDSQYICDSYCTIPEIQDLLGANIRQGYIIDGAGDTVKHQGDIADDADRSKGVDSECLRAGKSDYTCAQEARKSQGSYMPPSAAKMPQQITMIGKHVNKDAKRHRQNDFISPEVVNPQRTFEGNTADGRIVPIGHSDNAYLWPAGFEPAAGGAQCEGGIAIQPGDAIEYYGDSTVYGLDGANGARAPKTAPASFAEALDGQYTVRNEGVSEGTACDLLAGADKVHPAWEAQMKGSDAKVVILNFALNDQWKTDNVEAYSECLRSLAKIAKDNGKQVVFETPNPDGNPEHLGIYVDAMRMVATDEKIPLIDQYKFLMEYLAGGDVKTISPDSIHPSEAVYDMKGKFAASVFGELAAGCSNNN